MYHAAHISNSMGKEFECYLINKQGQYYCDKEVMRDAKHARAIRLFFPTADTVVVSPDLLVPLLSVLFFRIILALLQHKALS